MKQSTLSHKIAIVIPARFASSRFPGKPLHVLAGKTMVQRVYELAMQAKQGLDNIQVIIATEDQRIADHVTNFGGQAVLTAANCPSGSDRSLAAVQTLEYQPDYVLNLQGDAPLTPISVIRAMLQKLQTSDHEILTPVVQLSWRDLDNLRQSKLDRPFSGTTALLNQQGEAFWFSKQIIPAIRNEQKLRDNQELSPVYKHIGLYAFRYQVLQKFTKLELGFYEQLEGLEQLRLLEHGYKINTVCFNSNQVSGFQGVDTLADAKEVARKLLA